MAERSLIDKKKRQNFLALTNLFFLVERSHFLHNNKERSLPRRGLDQSP